MKRVVSLFGKHRNSLGDTGIIRARTPVFRGESLIGACFPLAYKSCMTKLDDNLTVSGAALDSGVAVGEVGSGFKLKLHRELALSDEDGEEVGSPAFCPLNEW
jgi:hypothetical protein